MSHGASTQGKLDRAPRPAPALQQRDPCPPGGRLHRNPQNRRRGVPRRLPWPEQHPEGVTPLRREVQATDLPRQRATQPCQCDVAGTGAKRLLEGPPYVLRTSGGRPPWSITTSTRSSSHAALRERRGERLQGRCHPRAPARLRDAASRRQEQVTGATAPLPQNRSEGSRSAPRAASPPRANPHREPQIR